MLLVVIMIPLSSTQMKLVMILDFKPLRAQFMLITCILELLMNQFAMSLIIGIMTCFCNGPLVVMFN